MREPQPDNFGLAAGISAGVKIFFIFLGGFLLVNYAPPLSILLAIIGGVAGGWVFAWWKSKADQSQLKPTTAAPIAEPEPLDKGGRQNRKYNKKKRQSGSFFSNIFGRR